MPGAGKTSAGRIIARRLGRGFIDTDDLLERQNGKPLAELLRINGRDGFRKLEEAMLLALQARNSVIATGGSVVYSAPGMAALRQLGTIVFLDCPLDVLESRVGDHAARGMVIAPDQTLADLYRERKPLYQRYAEVVVWPVGEVEQVAEGVVEALRA